MKRCLQCGAVYDDDSFFCEIDGQKLVEIEEEPEVTEPVGDEPEEPEPIESEPIADEPIEVEPEGPVYADDQEPEPIPEADGSRGLQSSFEPVEEPVIQTPEPVNSSAQNQGDNSVSFNYGMTTIEKAVAGVLIGIMVLAVIFGVLFMTGVLGGKQ